MITRHETQSDKEHIWNRLAAPVPKDAIAWRQDGRPTARDGKHFARFVCYIEANTVRERLDGIVPGEWDLTLELLPHVPDGNGVEDGASCSFKARLQILGVIREDVGTGKDYKQAATDAFKRAAVRFGIGHELYAYEQNWVEVDGDGKWAKPVEDPQKAYERRYGKRGDAVEYGAGGPEIVAVQHAANVEGRGAPPGAAAPPFPSAENPECPKCGGQCWDNRASKRNPRAPDFKCRDRSCDGVIWPPKTAAAPKSGGGGKEPVTFDGVGPNTDEIPY